MPRLWLRLWLRTAPGYLTLQTATGDAAHLSWKISSIGVYRLWRDGGYVVGGLAAGVPTGLLDTQWAIGTTGALTVFSGLVLTGVMYKTLPSAGAVS